MAIDMGKTTLTQRDTGKTLHCPYCEAFWFQVRWEGPDPAEFVLRCDRCGAECVVKLEVKT